MRFTPLSIEGAWSVEVKPAADERGHFARTWCQDEFAAHGIAAPMVQASLSFNRLRGTLRGMHFAWPPAREGKLVRCTRGRVHDVLLDLRPASATFLTNLSVVLEHCTGNAVYIPPGVAHGFQSLADDSEVLYMMTERYAPALADGVRHDDPAFGIAWPLPVSIVADRDRSYPWFDRASHLARHAKTESARDAAEAPNRGR